MCSIKIRTMTTRSQRSMNSERNVNVIQSEEDDLNSWTNQEEEEEEEIGEEQFRCPACKLVQSISTCYLCDIENTCKTCVGSGRYCSRGEEWICQPCDDKQPEEEEEEEEEDVHSIVRNSIVSYLPASELTYECWSISKIYLCWILVHIISVNLYCYFCAHISLYGLFMSPFMAVAPHCVAFRWLTTNSINSISNMWLTLGTWLITKLPGVNLK